MSIDISQYADAKFDQSQMYVIRLGLEAKVDVSQYADPRFSADQMYVIYLDLEVERIIKINQQ